MYRIEGEEEIIDDSKYLDGIPRVSELVSHIYPFEGYAKDQYLKWLGINGIPEEDYLLESQDVGTFCHKQLQLFLEGGNKFLETSSPYFSLHRKEIVSGIAFLMKLALHPDNILLTEQYILDDAHRYQGTSDLVVINEEEKKVWLFDWKTWGIAKKRWGLPNNFKKPYDKIKKVALQLSLYAEYYRKKGYTVEGLYVVWLHETGAHPFELDIYSSKDLNAIINSYYTALPDLPQDIDLYLNKKEMIVRVNTNIQGMAYTNAEITLEKDDCEGMTWEEKIQEAIRLQKLLVQQYGTKS